MFFLSSVLCLPLSVFCSLYARESFAAEPFFVTIEKVELKNASGEWVDVIEPDKRVDLTMDEPSVSFFNNGRIAPGDYTNVRVTLIDGETLQVTRADDYIPPLSVKKGSFVNVSFVFNLESRPLSQESIQEAHLTVDQDERVDGGDKIKLWF